MKRIDRSRPEPLYHQLERVLRERILSGEWSAGSQIPTEEQLCELYDVSRVTIRQAVRNLVEDGYLERGRGRGTFVREPILTAGERGLRSFSEEMRALGLTPGATVLNVASEIADETVSERLQLAAGAKVARIRRLRTGDGRPIGLQTSYLPLERFPDLTEADLADHSLYDLLRRRYGVVAHEARETFWVAKVPRAEARLLQVETGAPAFRVERVACDAEGPFEFTTSLMRGDRYRIQWVLKTPHLPNEETS